MIFSRKYIYRYWFIFLGVGVAVNNKEIALNLVLRAIGESTQISSVDDRMRIQKAIYLSQEFGIPLGYNYSWYVKGPYSPGLTQDYYGMNASISDEDIKDVNINSKFSSAIEKTIKCLQYND